MTSMTVRIALREKREALGLSQTALAEKAGVRQATISQIEAGTTRIDLNVLERLAAALKCEPGELLERGQRQSRGRTQ